LKFIYEISQALITLEEYEIIHGDIKPENIYIANDGSFKLGINFFFFDKKFYFIYFFLNKHIFTVYELIRGIRHCSYWGSNNNDKYLWD
jgi:serine/threonine protein kinase